MKKLCYVNTYAHKKTNYSTGSFIILLLVLILNSCQKETLRSQPVNAEIPGIANKSSASNGLVSPAMVLAWNDIATQAFIHFPEQPAPPPMIESRIYAMVNIAMHDALNNIKKKYKTYALNSWDKDADPDAAIAQAAYDILLSEAPWYANAYNTLLASSLNSIINGDGKTKGIALGHAAAAAIKNNRSNDGLATAQGPYTNGNLPGQYQFTAPFDGPPFNGFYALPNWGKVKPFGLASGSQFRPDAPYAVNSNEYTADYNEIKSLGSANSTTRTADQTHLALFWAESSPLGWNRIATTIINNQKGNNMDAWKAARLFALLQIAEADAYIGSCEAKVYYNYWRPVTAIHNAAGDGNPNTLPDANWQVLLFPTPPIADYPSAHATAGGAGAAVISSFFENDNISFTTSSSTNNGTRSFSSLSQAAMENALSRIYIGYHFRNACIKGKNMGYEIGIYVFNNTLRPN